MKTTSVIFVMIVTWSATGIASTTDFGNGGDIVMCPGDWETQQGLFYDVYEANARYNITAQFPAVAKCDLDSSGDYADACKVEAQKVASQMVSRLKKIDPEFEATLQSFVRTFWAETRLVDAELFPIADSGVGFIPVDCTLQQLAIQHVPKNKDDKRYFIAVNLLKYLSVEEQGTLILHEILYRWAVVRNSQITFSERVRYFNALIFSDRISHLSDIDYLYEKNALVAN